MRPQRWRAALEGLRARAEHATLPLAAVSADIRLLAYQLEPWFAFQNGARRVLLADAVGLGKTIQAGLMLAEVFRRGEGRRALVVTPGHLCAQWAEELQQRFALTARVTDAQSLAALTRDLPPTANPWSLDGVSIVSVDFIKQTHVAGAIPPDPWDVIIIDEAHSLGPHTDRLAVCHELAQLARRVLLLTATPYSGIHDASAVMALGEWQGQDPLVVLRRTREDVGMRLIRRSRSLRVHAGPALQQALDAVGAFGRAAIRAADREPRDSATTHVTQLLVSIFVKRALSSCEALRRSLQRREQVLKQPSPNDSAPTQLALFDEGDDVPEGPSALSGDIERAWLKRLLAAANRAASRDRKLQRLVDLLRRTSEPAIVFTEFRDTLLTLEAALQPVLRLAIAHGGMSTTELSASLAAFRKGDVRVLIATDVASQGLNLHDRARWVIQFDLPWNPIRLEQRVGRVDRIGQARAVHVTSVSIQHALNTAFVERLGCRTSAAVDATAALGDNRWRRRARAAARVLERRRARATQWRGPDVTGRPWRALLNTKRAPHHSDTVRATDVIGAGGVIIETIIAQGAAPAELARVRRVRRLAGTQARRAADIERALLWQLRAREVCEPSPRRPRVARDTVVSRRQLELPGARTARDQRHAGRRAAEAAAARHTVTTRLEQIERWLADDNFTTEPRVVLICE